jgi:putative hydroxymethylpyrimidine transport system ATP-binding protein
MTSPTLVLKNIDFTFKNQHLFHQLNLTIPGNKITCLLGPSGIGKTTLLQLIAGLVKPSNTDYELYADNHRPLCSQVSYLFQTDALLPWLSLLDNTLIGHTLRKTKTPSLEKKALEFLEHMGLSASLHKKIYELSGGMRQRVALARTLLEDRPIVLMDEPFASLDIKTRHHLQNLTAEVLKNKTVVLVTHDPLEALRLGHEIKLLTHLGITESITLDSPSPRAVDDENIALLHPQLLKKILLEPANES